MKISILLLFVVVLEGTCGQGIFNPCYFWPDSVYAGDGMCFKLFNKQLTFQESLSACEREGATLAEARTPQQRHAYGSEAWLGGSSLPDGTNLAWLSDQTPIDLPWTAGEPQGTELCIVLDATSQLAARSCGNSLSYICQIEAGNPCDIYLPGAEYYDNNCFLPVNKPMNLHDAELNCQKRDAILAEPRDDSLFRYMTDSAGWNFEPTDAIWLGIFRGDVSLHWRSLGDPVSASYWSANGPGSDGVTADSGVVMLGTEGWLWEAAPQSGLAKVVCQRDLSAECAGVFSLGRCFTLYHHESTRKWEDAKVACEEAGSYLAEPKSEILHRTVVKYATDTSTDKAFLGATDLETEGDWVWDYSREHLVDTYTAWANGQPDNNLGNENFLEYRSTIGGWNDVNNPGPFFGVAKPYICERIVPLYLHSYVVVFPRTETGGQAKYTKAMLSVASHPHQWEHNYVQILKFPGGQIETTSLFGYETFQYNIDTTDLTLDTNGFQQKYVRVRSTNRLDVHFFLWSSQFKYTCASLIFEELTDGQSTAFFSNLGPEDASLAIVSTNEEDSSLNFVISTEFDNVKFTLNEMETQTRDMFTVSTTLPGLYHSLFVDSISGSTTGQLTHSTGPLAVFRFGREHQTVSTDVSCDQILPVSGIGSDYVTFPSLPLDPEVTDHYTVVAVYGNTTVTVYDPDPAVATRSILLLWPGDTFHLELPASGFYHVNGTDEFYLYASLTGTASSSGLCSLHLFHDGLFRDSYQLSVVGPLVDMTAVYIVIIVKSRDKGSVTVIALEGGGVTAPEECRPVTGTQWTGCYFLLPSTDPKDIYLVDMDDSGSSMFGAYLFATRNVTLNTMCFPLGVSELPPEHVSYDFNEYIDILKSKQLCGEGTSSPVTTEKTKTHLTTEDMTTTNHGATSQPTPEEMTTTDHDITSQPQPVLIEPSNVKSDSMDTTTVLLDEITTPTQIESVVSTSMHVESTGCQEVNILNTNITLNADELEAILEKIITHLSVNTEALSKVRRAKISAPDDRVSSTTMGLFSLLFIGVTLGLIFMLDINKIVTDIRSSVYVTGSVSPNQF